MTDKSALLISRLNEYADLSYMDSSYVKFTDFLDEFECSAAISLYKNRYFENYRLFGGYSEAVRKILCVYSDDAVLSKFPIRILKLKFNNTEYLSHRNILGALMNLNIKRSLIGDICVFDDSAYVICTALSSEVIKTDLKTVGKSGITIEEIKPEEFCYTPKTEEKTVIIASERLDCIVSALCDISRAKASEYIASSLVFINGEAVKNESKKISEGVKLSVRGYGKFILCDLKSRTHKGRIKLVAKKFI